MSETVLYCIWPKCDEHCTPTSIVCSRQCKKVKPAPTAKGASDAQP
jgi:hypothetical protein